MMESIYIPVGRVVLRTIGDDSLLVPVDGRLAGGRIYPVNETARLVWQHLSRGGTVRAAVDELTARYEVSSAEAESDCLECLRAFLEEGLLEESD